MGKRGPKAEAKDLIEIVAQIIHDRQDEVKISPSWIATEAMVVLDAARLRKKRPLVYLGCHMHLRHIARGICAKAFEDEDAKYQHELFPGLQRRYPQARKSANEEPQYVKLEATTKEDLLYNMSRLKGEITTKQGHFDALLAYFQQKYGPLTESVAS